MPTFAVTYQYEVDTETTRDEFRPAHVDFLRSIFESGSLVISGQLLTSTPGALLVFEAESETALIELLDRDPFAEAGVIASRTVAPWKIFFDIRSRQ